MRINHSLQRLKLLIIIFYLCLAGCGSQDRTPIMKNVDVPPPPSSNNSNLGIEGELNGFSTIQRVYEKLNENIANPGRGFYQHTETYTSDYLILNEAELTANRNSYQSSLANYDVKSTMILRAIILDNYVDDKILPQALLNYIQLDFDIARAAGIKMVLRFYYHKNSTPPYGDPDKETILSHIQQLKPLLTRNADVILAIQQGFIGAWGEQYYSDKFSPESGVDDSYTTQNWIDRSEVLEALLDATAPSTMVQVRTPQAKQKFIYGTNASITEGAYGSPNSLTRLTAFSDKDIARIGFHNDCFLTDQSDTGTYYDYGTDGVREGNAVAILRNYHINDSRYVIVGGETCADESWASPPVAHKNNCSDNIVNKMDALNFSYLNADYNNSVNNDWAEGDDACMDEIKNKLGYRFAIKEATIVALANAGNYIPIHLIIENEGFTSPVTPMELRLILKHKTSGAETTIYFDKTNNDIRKWQKGIAEVAAYFKLPDDLATGEYSVHLHIADITNNGSIAHRPEYSVRLANAGVWDATTGYNDLNHSIIIGEFIEGDEKNKLPTILISDHDLPPKPSMIDISIDGNADDWENIPAIASADEQQLTSFKVASDEFHLYFFFSGNDLGPYFDVFINTDVDHTTGFQSSDWVVSGADYLLERGSNGLVELLKSTGTGWDWKNISSSKIDVNGDSNFIEFSIEKSNFEALGASISLGVNDVLAQGWTTQSRLPLIGSAMTIYTMP